MDSNHNEELKILKNNELNVYKNVHLFFYSYSGNDLLLLLNKKNGEEYKEFFTTILPSDELPTFAVSRLMATTYRGLLRESNIEKLMRKEELTKEDILASDEFQWYSIWSNEAFTDWLDQISDNPIQFDSFEGKMIYFLEIPFIDLEFLNKNLESLNYAFKFTFFKYDYSTINTINRDEHFLSASTSEIMKKFDFNFHIQKTINMFQENNVDYFIILACKKVGNKRDQAGFFHFPALIPGIYRKNNEKWIYMVASDELPNESLLNKCKAVIIPGSELNIYNEFDFLRKTEDFVRSLLANYPKIKFLGLCFGLQLLVNALGGKVENMGDGVFVHGAEKLFIDEEFWNFEFVKNSSVERSDSLVIRQAHGDYVSLMPCYNSHKIKIYAHSETCATEILVSDDERVFCVQGHPEYETEFAMSRVADFLCIRSKLQPTTENKIKMKELAIQQEKYPELHCRELRMICNSFLKN